VKGGEMAMEIGNPPTLCTAMHNLTNPRRESMPILPSSILKTHRSQSLR